MSSLEQAAETSLTPRRCVVVDDSEDMRFIVSRILRRRYPAARVDVATDAAGAIKLLESEADGADVLVVSDYDMGEGPTGTELLAQVALRWPRATRLLFTGHTPDRIVGSGEAPHAVLSKDGGMIGLTRFFAALHQAAPRMDGAPAK